MFLCCVFLFRAGRILIAVGFVEVRRLIGGRLVDTTFRASQAMTKSVLELVSLVACARFEVFYDYVMVRLSGSQYCFDRTHELLPHP